MVGHSFRRACLSAVLLLLSHAAWAGSSDAPEQVPLEKLRAYVAEVQEQVARLQSALRKAEQRNRDQSALIDRLEASLRARQAKSPAGQERVRQEFFAGLAARLPLSPVYSIARDRIVIAADPVFVFSRALIGAEGESRLDELASALREATGALPETSVWRLRVEGHTDARPLRNNSRFSGNWDLSAARATEMVRYLVLKGLDEQHLEAVALAATVPLGEGGDKAAYRRDRRIELHLVFPGASP